jgi:polyhydroxybutyrate depolymerase
VPAALDEPAPLILNFHGFASTATEQSLYSGMSTRGAAAGSIVVTPEGYGTVQHWNFLPAAGEPDDYQLVTDLLDSLGATGCVDADRVYSTGISNGSAFTAFLACRLHDRLAAIALVAATVQPIGCPPGTQMPVLAFHGTADPVVPYAGGTVGGNGAAGGLPVAPAEQAIAQWAAVDGCEGTPTPSSVAADVTLLDFAACDGGLAVQLYRVEGGGHTWPGGPEVPRLGPVTHSIDATDLMLDFFAAHTGTH